MGPWPGFFKVRPCSWDGKESSEVQHGSVGRSQMVLMGTHFLRLGLGLATTIVIGRSLSAADLGLFALVAAIFLFGRFFLDLGTGVLAAREISRKPAREAALVGGLVALRGLLALLAGAAIATFATFEAGPSRQVLFATAAAFPLLAYGGFAVSFQLRQRPMGPALFGILSQVLVVCGVLWLPAVRVPGAYLALLLVLREVLDSVALKWMARRILGVRARFRLRGIGLRPLLRQALQLGAASVLQLSYFHADVFLVRWVRGPEELGAYAASFRAINPLVMVPGLMMGPLLPLLAWVSGRWQRFRLVVGSASAFLLGIGALGASLGVVLAPEILGLLYGGRYLAGPLSSVAAFRFLSVALGAIFATGALGSALIGSGGERGLLRLGLLGLGVNILGNALMIPRTGYNGAALMTAITEIAVMIGSGVLLRRRCGVFFRRSQLWVLAPSLAPPLLLLLPDASPWKLILGFAIGLCGSALLWISRPMRRARAFQERLDARRLALSSPAQPAE